MAAMERQPCDDSKRDADAVTRVRTAIDLFCDEGGLSEGFRQAGYDILAGNDIFDSAGVTFSKSHPKAKFLPGPIQDITVEKLLAETGLKFGALDCLIGGPPCQAFSVYNHKRGLHDTRANLFMEYLRIVDGLKPLWIVMENVTGIFSAGHGAVVEAIHTGLRNHGYHVEHRILKAEEYGVPQERRRVVFIGNRIGAPIFWPSPTHGPGKASFNTIRDAISDLPGLRNGEDKGAQEYTCQPQSPYQALLRENSNIVLNHCAPGLGPANRARMKHIPPGGSWRDIPFELLPKGMKRAKRSDHTKRYGRMHWDGLSCTILTKCDIHWGAYIHPEQDRAISVREAARIQSFPDTFVFSGSKTEQFIQVGNAVPPMLGQCIAKAVIASDDAKIKASPQALAV